MFDSHSTLVPAAARFRAAARLYASHERDDEYLTPELRELLSLIGQQDEWRVFVDGTPNFGHQASTVILLMRLIDLSKFIGRAVIVYADYERPGWGRTIDKLAMMFNGLDPANPASSRVRYGTCGDIRFCNFQSRSGLSEPIAFGFTGGADDMHRNYARELNVRFFARIQPYLWDDETTARKDTYFETSRIEQPDGRHMNIVDALPEFRRLAIKPGIERLTSVDTTVWNWFCDAQQYDEGLACRTRNARAAYAEHSSESGRQRARPLLWPVYGLQHFQDEVAEMFLTLTLCALALQNELGRPIVLVSFNPHNRMPEWDMLMSALADDTASGDDTLPNLREAVRSRYAEAFRAGRFIDQRLGSWIDTLSAWLQAAGASKTGIAITRTFNVESNRWHELGEGFMDASDGEKSPSLRFVELGPVPMDVFHHCLAVSDLPAVIEGQVSSNLMTTIGLPFLQVLRAEHVIKNGYAGSIGDSNRRSLAEEICSVALLIRDLSPTDHLESVGFAPPEEYVEGIGKLVDLVKDMLDPSGAAGRYFAALGRKSRRNETDKLLIGLLALREVVVSDSST